MTKKKRKVRVVDPAQHDPALALALATGPLLELFAVVDDVFTEDNALSPENRQMGLARIYRQWKKSRTTLDPNFNSKRDSLVKRRTAK